MAKPVATKRQRMGWRGGRDENDVSSASQTGELGTEALDLGGGVRAFALSGVPFLAQRVLGERSLVLGERALVLGHGPRFALLRQLLGEAEAILVRLTLHPIFVTQASLALFMFGPRNEPSRRWATDGMFAAWS